MLEEILICYIFGNITTGSLVLDVSDTETLEVEKGLNFTLKLYRVVGGDDMYKFL